LLEFLGRIVVIRVVLRRRFALTTRFRDGARKGFLAKANPSPVSEAAEHVAFMRRVHQHDSQDICGMLRGVESHQKAANRVSDEHVWAMHSCGVEKQMQLKHFLLHGARRGTRFAPTQTSAVVRAHSHTWR
jgi:ribosomal protein L35AE/L33A